MNKISRSKLALIYSNPLNLYVHVINRKLHYLNDNAFNFTYWISDFNITPFLTTSPALEEYDSQTDSIKSQHALEIKTKQPEIYQTSLKKV